jgi:predicted metal-dependent phosphoesterase TrpH
VEKIPPRGLSLPETLLHIGGLGGIAVAPHPFNQLPGSLNLDNVVSVLTKPALKNIMRGIEVYNMSTQPFDKRVQRLSAYLPFAKTAGSDAHVYWAVGTGKTEFSGTSAAQLRTALENGTTIAHPFADELSRKQVLNWLRRITMRKFGYVSDSLATEDRISTQRVDLSFTKMQSIQARKDKIKE